jgi:hypothetical protein
MYLKFNSRVYNRVYLRQKDVLPGWGANDLLIAGRTMLINSAICFTCLSYDSFEIAELGN